MRGIYRITPRGYIHVLSSRHLYGLEGTSQKRYIDNETIFKIFPHCILLRVIDNLGNPQLQPIHRSLGQRRKASAHQQSLCRILSDTQGSNRRYDTKQITNKKPRMFATIQGFSAFLAVVHRFGRLFYMRL